MKTKLLKRLRERAELMIGIEVYNVDAFRMYCFDGDCKTTLHYFFEINDTVIDLLREARRNIILFWVEEERKERNK